MAPSNTLVQLEGWQGDWFTLHGPNQGNRGVVLNGLDGIVDAPVITSRSKTAFRPGALDGGKRWEEREVTITATVAPALATGRADGDFELLDSDFRKAWSYSADSKLWIQTRSGRRHLPLRLSSAPRYLTKLDPHRKQYGQIELDTVALVPWWIEPDVVDTWVSQDAGVQEGAVRIENPTDRPMWLKWTITAPGTWTLPDFSWYGSETFSPDDLPADIADAASTSTARKIVMPPLSSGVGVDIDTDPFEEQVVRPGFPNFWSLMNGVQFCFPVPPWTPPTDLPVKVDGPAGSTVAVMCEREWTRPWGMR